MCLPSFISTINGGRVQRTGREQFQETKQLQGCKKEKSPDNSEDFSSVPGAGIEPAQVLPHWCLRPARLPIPPSGPQSLLIVKDCKDM